MAESRNLSFMQVARQAVGLLSPAERRQAGWLTAAVVAAALIEAVSVSTIVPFVAVLSGQTGSLPQGGWRDALGRLGLSSDLSQAWGLGALCIVMVVGSAVFSLVVRHRLLLHCHGSYHDLSSRLYERLLQAPYAFYLGQHPAKLTEAILVDAEAMASKVLLGLMLMLSNLAVCLGIAVVLLLVHPLVAVLVAAGVGGLYVGVYGWMHRRIRRLGHQAQVAADEQARIVHESLRGAQEVRAFGAQAYFLLRYMGVSRKRADAMGEAVALSELPRKAIEAVAIGGAMTMALYAAQQRGQATAFMPLLALYLFAAYRLLPMAQQIFQNSVRVKFHAPAVAHLDALLRHPALAPTTVVAHPDPQAAFSGFRHELTLTQVGFAYQGDRPGMALHGVSMRIQAGQFVGIVGASGSGKSTLIALLLGLLVPSQGQLDVDGQPLSGIAPADWRRTIGFVPQHITLLDDTVATNIAFGDPEPDLLRVRQAAAVAGLHDFIEGRLPHAYQTRVGADGVGLSGGERQRLGIARAIYADPSVLILDEATSSLDPDTEDAVMRNILAWRQGRTVVAIAHRQATLTACDTVHVFDGGRLKASGSGPDVWGLAAQAAQTWADRPAS